MADAKQDKVGGRGIDPRWAGVGVGIGSAALVAALLYANRDRVAQAVGRKPKPVEHED